MTNEFLEEEFKSLLYDFYEINWNILTKEAHDKYLVRNEKFTDNQLSSLRDFIKNFNDCLTDEPKTASEFYCQSDLEWGWICKKQCSHCKEYYKHLEK